MTKEPDMFDGDLPLERKPAYRKVTNPSALSLKVTPAARVIAQAIANLGNPIGSTEPQIVGECARMRAAGQHTYDEGGRTNLRNRIQRNCSFYKIYREEWGPKGYADIFVRVPGDPVRFKLVPGFKANL